jgi:hypothetical protein
MGLTGNDLSSTEPYVQVSPHTALQERQQFYKLFLIYFKLTPSY